MQMRDKKQPRGSRASASRRGLRLLLGALTLLLALSAAFATPCLAADRPFSLQGTTALAGNPFDPAGAAMVGGHGTATYLGAWTNTGRVFFVPGNAPPFAAWG